MNPDFVKSVEPNDPNRDDITIVHLGGGDDFVAVQKGFLKTIELLERAK